MCYNFYVTYHFLYYATIGGSIMSRFNEFNYDKEKWELITKEELDKTFNEDITVYSLKNLSTNEVYALTEDNRFYYGERVTGIEQISDHDFLVFSHFNDHHVITRFSFNESKGIFCDINFCVGSGFVTLNDDKIWLKDWQIYSISKNSIIKTLEPFNHTKTEWSLKANSDGKKFLYCKMSFSSRVDGTDYLLFVFDAETLLPALPAFSSLRGDRFIELSNNFTFADLIKEEEKYKNCVSSYIESFLESVGKDSVMKAEHILLSSLVDKA